jgi:hypothetical protein
MRDFGYRTAAVQGSPKPAEAGLESYPKAFIVLCKLITRHPELYNSNSPSCLALQFLNPSCALTPRPKSHRPRQQPASAFQTSLIIPSIEFVTWNTPRIEDPAKAMATNNMHNLTTLIKRYCDTFFILQKLSS